LGTNVINQNLIQEEIKRRLISEHFVLLRVFENRMLRRKFGPKEDKVTGGWRELHNEKLRDLYSSPSIIRMLKPWRMGRRVMRIGYWWESQMILKWDRMNWIDLGQDRDR
jgi:hypothetical protein